MSELSDGFSAIESESIGSVASEWQFLEFCADLYCVCTPDGKFDRVSARWMSVLGWSDSELRSRSWLDFVHPDDRAMTRAAMDRSQVGEPFRCDHRGLHKDGSHRWLVWRGRRDRNGYLHAIAYDISDRREAQLETEIAGRQHAETALREQWQELQAAFQELQSAQTQLIQNEKMSGLSQLVGGIAHEINNPINFIYGNLSYAKEYAFDLLHILALYQAEYDRPSEQILEAIDEVDLDFLKDDLPRLLDSMKVGSERIRNLVISLRNFSRLDESALKAVDLHDGLESTLLILRNRFKSKPDYPEIEVVRSYSELPLVECYAGQINQVFLNIIANAIDAIEDANSRRTPEELEARSSTIQLTTESNQPGWVKISISDTGAGMSEQVRAKMFDPFYTTKPVGKGTGIGLAIAYQIVVERHRGKMSCYSTPGYGTELHIELPVRQIG
jgi:PAS domain S-box-containing protein